MQINRDLLARSWRNWLGDPLEPVGPAWLQWVWTLLFSAAIALLFTLLGFAFDAGRGGTGWTRLAAWQHWYAINFVISLTIAVTIHLLFMLIIPWLGPARIRRFSHGGKAAFFTAIPLLGLVIGWPLGVWLVGQRVSTWIRFDSPQALVGSAALALLISFVFFLFFNAKARQLEAEKRASEAQLRLLQAQMEPHFLFNTLANVLTLIDSDTARAKSMLESFTDYLRSSLGSMRRSDSTLGQELELAEAYLRLLQLRMDNRLRFRVEVDADVRRATLPPLLLQPLIENAIVHGLEPKIEGGEICIAAHVDGNSLVLTVADDGLGPEVQARHRPGNGVAVENIRQRLAAHFGAAGSLTLAGRQPGTLATLRLPFERGAA